MCVPTCRAYGCGGMRVVVRFLVKSIPWVFVRYLVKSIPWVGWPYPFQSLLFFSHLFSFFLICSHLYSFAPFCMRDPHI